MVCLFIAATNGNHGSLACGLQCWPGDPCNILIWRGHLCYLYMAMLMHALLFGLSISETSYAEFLIPAYLPDVLAGNNGHLENSASSVFIQLQHQRLPHTCHTINLLYRRWGAAIGAVKMTSQAATQYPNRSWDRGQIKSELILSCDCYSRFMSVHV